MPNPVSIINFDFIRNILQYVQVVRADDLGETTPLHTEEGYQVQIMDVPISQVTGVAEAVSRWNAEFHREPWWVRDHSDKLPWWLV